MSDLYGEFAVTAGGRNVGRLHVTQDGLMTVYECACDIVSNDVLRLAAVSGGNYVPLGVVMPYDGALRLKKSFSKNTLLSMGLHNAETFHLIRPGEVYTGSSEAVNLEDFSMGSPIPEPVKLADEIKPAAVNPALMKAVEQMLTQLTAEPAKPEGKPAPYQPQPEPEPQALIAEPMQPPVNFRPALEEPAEERILHYMPGQREAIPQPGYGGWRPTANPSNLFNDETIAEACEEVSGALVMEQAGLTLLAVPVSPDAPFPMMPIFCFGSSEEIGGQEYIIFKIKNGYLSV